MQFVITAIGWLMGKIIADNVLRFVATKLLMTAFFLVILPLILNNFLYDIIDMILGLAGSSVTAVGALDGSMSFTGFAAWLIERFRIAECLSVLCSALLMRLCI